MRILVTRPLPDGQRTAETLRTRGHDVLLAPLMRVKPVPADLTGVWRGVIITSANAIRAVPAEQLGPLQTLPLFAVGDRSAEAARGAGFQAVHTSHGDASDLVHLIAARGAGDAQPYLYLTGADRAADIEGELKRLGIAATARVVYRMVTTGFSPDLTKAVEQGALDLVLHFSRRSAENYLAGAKDAGLVAPALKPRQLCMARNVATPLIEAGAMAVDIASRPDEASLLTLVAQSSS